VRTFGLMPSPRGTPSASHAHGCAEPPRVHRACLSYTSRQRSPGCPYLAVRAQAERIMSRPPRSTVASKLQTEVAATVSVGGRSADLPELHRTHAPHPHPDSCAHDEHGQPGACEAEQPAQLQSRLCAAPHEAQLQPAPCVAQALQPQPCAWAARAGTRTNAKAAAAFTTVRRVGGLAVGRGRTASART
jgi:hypothetical protein